MPKIYFEIPRHSTNNSHQSAFGLEMGYHFNQQAFTFTPNIRLDYFKKDTDKFSEHFSDSSAVGSSLGMAIELGQFKSLTTTLGLQTEYTASKPWGVLVSHVNLDWVHEFKNKRYSMTARFL